MNAEETVIKEEVVSDVECEKMDTEPVIKEEVVVCDVVRGKSDSEPVIKEEIVVSNVDGGNSDSERIVKEEIVACDVKSEPVIEAEFVACDADWGKNSNINIKTEPSSSHEIDVLHVSTDEILKEELISDVEWEKSDSEPEIQTGPSSTHENVPKLSADPKLFAMNHSRARRVVEAARLDTKTKRREDEDCKEGDAKRSKGKRPYPCSECDYKAVSKSILICHMRSHTGERPFACQLCDYRGTQRTSLVVHMKTHTGEDRNELLISEIHKCPVIWNKFCEDSKNKFLVETAWENISQIMLMPKETVKAKWKNLRDVFNRELKKMSVIRSGEEADEVLEYKGKWQHFPQMCFLKQGNLPRTTEGNLLDEDSASASTELPPPVDASGPKTDLIEVSPDIVDEEVHCSSKLPQSQPMDLTHELRPPEKKLKSSMSAFEEAIIDIEERKLAIIKRHFCEKDEDSEQKFFQSCLPFFKKMSALQKLRVRKEMLSILLRIVNENSPT